MKLLSFESVPILPDAARVYRALGHTSETTVSDALKKDLDKYVEEARGFVALKGVCARLDVLKTTTKEVHLEEKIVFKSADLAFFLNGSSQVLIFGATAGQKIMDVVSQKTAEKDLTRAVVYNAVAGEMVDEALTWISQYCRHQIRRESLVLDTRRFSAGYGDLDIKYQKFFWECLKLDAIGVTLTKNYFLVPEKSVTAISGIRTGY